MTDGAHKQNYVHVHDMTDRVQAARDQVESPPVRSARDPLYFAL